MKHSGDKTFVWSTNNYKDSPEYNPYAIPSTDIMCHLDIRKFKELCWTFRNEKIIAAESAY